ncbi:MAG: cysteine hydrolase [Nitrososphaerota archaeon]|nr:cysteine hydrolase [Nitrososphaerota archaeon]MDG6923487.1 cysteine hydrolase [Nitrososphaerota archaeon]
MQTERIILDPNRTVLGVIDIQNEFVKRGGRLYSENDRPRITRMISKTAQLLQRCRDLGVRIIFVQSIRAPDAPQFKVFGIFQRLLEGTWNAEIIDELRPTSGEPMVKKRSHDCFIDPIMDKTLERMRVEPLRDTVILVGGSISTCLYHAWMGFRERYYQVVIPTDCTYGPRDGIDFVRCQANDEAYRYNSRITESGNISFEEN